MSWNKIKLENLVEDQEMRHNVKPLRKMKEVGVFRFILQYIFLESDCSDTSDCWETEETPLFTSQKKLHEVWKIVEHGNQKLGWIRFDSRDSKSGKCLKSAARERREAGEPARREARKRRSGPQLPLFTWAIKSLKCAQTGGKFALLCSL